MKQICLLLIVSLITSQFVTAQRNGSFFMSIDQGISLPQGKFKATEFQAEGPSKTEVNGLARPGYHFSLSGGYRFNKSVGIMMQVGYGFNPQDKKSYERWAKQAYGNDYDIKVKTESWNIFKALGGLNFQQPLVGKKLFFEGKLLGGIAKTKEPGYQVNGSKNIFSPQPGAFEIRRTKINLPVTFAWQANAGFGSWLNDQLYVLLDINYFDSKPVYEFDYQFPGQPPGHGKYEYSLANVGVNVVVGVKL